MERPYLSRVLGRVFWGGDTKAYYESMAAIGETADGDTIVDCPCGAGPAFRALEPGRGVRYAAADLSPAMLRRARARAARRGLDGIEFIESKAEELPLEDASADLFLSFWGLHCFPDPAAAVAEIGRVLKPGGRLVGASFVRGPSLRQRLTLRPHRGDFGPMGTEADLLGWLAAANLELTEKSRSGLYMFFEARRAQTA
ncbi:MAG: class I SAM-dependent methyltransferase [Actinomycetota bacterium]|nr:class I SAM-dependent methyltransferase [Actinomycetota bacterium]